MFEQINGVIFDLDGTLVDSMWMWEKIDVEYLGRHRIPLPDDLQKSIEGMSFSETALYFKQRFGLDDSLETIKKDWNAMAYEKYKHEVFFKPGARALLEQLQKKGIPAGIATSNSRELLDTVLEALDSRHLFAATVTGCEVSRGKPAPDIYLAAAGYLGRRPSHCLVFEDVVMGIQAGKQAGMRVCAVEDSFSREDEKRKQKLADYSISSFEEILPLLI